MVCVEQMPELYMVNDLLRLEDGVQLNRPRNIDENYNNWSRGEDSLKAEIQQHRKTYPKFSIRTV